MKVSIDIEDLLIWAYRTQCVDRMAGQMSATMDARPPGIPSVSAIMAAHIALGCRVDSQPMQVMFLGASAPDDALIVHDAVLALDDAFIELGDGEFTLWDRALAEAEGAVIEEAGAMGWVLRRNCRAPRPLERIVLAADLIVHAKGAARPDVYADWSFRSDGRLYHKATRGADKGLGVTKRDVVRARARYTAWRLCLVLLARELHGMLAAWEPAAPAVSESPWARNGVVPKRAAETGNVREGQAIDIAAE